MAAKPLDPADLRATFGLPADRAVAYLTGKGYRIGWDWRETEAAAHARAFTVAKVARMDILADIRSALASSLQDGMNEREFIKALRPTLAAKGWWGKEERVDGETGEISRVQLGSVRRLQTIYRTNMQAAYMAGRYVEMQEASDTHPFWRYVAVMDAKTRPSHAAMHNRVFRHDDPAWNTAMPPNGFNCRCRVQALSEGGMARMGLKVESSAGKLSTMQVPHGTDATTGEVYSAAVTSLRFRGLGGRPEVFRVDPGFNSSPVASHLVDELLARRAQAALPSTSAAAAVRQVLLAPARLEAWRALVDGTLAAGRSQGLTFGVGLVDAAHLAHAAAAGAPLASAIVHVSDAGIAGSTGIGPATWRGLPQALAAPESVLWDTRSKSLLYVLPASSTRPSRTVVQVPAAGNSQGTPKGATVSNWTSSALEGALRSGVLQQLPAAGRAAP